MEIEWILMISAVVLVLGLWLGKSWRLEAPGRQSSSVAALAEVIRTAEVTNNGFFRSLELVQKNLESLIGRAEIMEQRLQTLMLQPGAEKREQYTAAALLLSEGHEAERVASMLNLPTAQVQLIRDLQQVTSRDKRSSPRPKRADEVSEKEIVQPKETVQLKEIVPQTESSFPAEKSADRPILLVDAIRNAAHQARSENGEAERLEGATA